MSEAYPYPVLDEDGYELEVIEQSEKDCYEFALPEFPTDDERFEVATGALVKLIFRYRDWIQEHGNTITCERMWVKVTGDSGACMTGSLDSSPHYTKLLQEGDLICFHPKHIVQIWRS